MENKSKLLNNSPTSVTTDARLCMANNGCTALPVQISGGRCTFSLSGLYSGPHSRLGDSHSKTSDNHSSGGQRQTPEASDAFPTQ